MIFSSEAQVRKWVRNHAEAVWWVENKRGGTFGMPDAVAIFEDQPWFLELKTAQKVDGSWIVEADPTQINIVREMRLWSLRAGFLCGVLGTDRLLFALPEGLERVSESSGVGGRQNYKMVPEVPLKWMMADGN